MRDKRELEHLGARLRAERLTPSSRLISAIVGLFPDRVQRRPKAASLRFALAAGLAVALVSAVAAVGGVGYAQKQVTHAVVAVKSTVQSTVTLKPSSSARPSAPAAAEDQYAGKTTICHHTNSKKNEWVVITVSNNALPAHKAHGDTLVGPGGTCPGPPIP
jgi:hypothetical protein